MDIHGWTLILVYTFFYKCTYKVASNCNIKIKFTAFFASETLTIFSLEDELSSQTNLSKQFNVYTSINHYIITSHVVHQSKCVYKCIQINSFEWAQLPNRGFRQLTWRRIALTEWETLTALPQSHWLHWRLPFQFPAWRQPCISNR